MAQSKSFQIYPSPWHQWGWESTGPQALSGGKQEKMGWTRHSPSRGRRQGYTTFPICTSKVRAERSVRGGGVVSKAGSRAGSWAWAPHCQGLPEAQPAAFSTDSHTPPSQVETLRSHGTVTVPLIQPFFQFAAHRSKFPSRGQASLGKGPSLCHLWFPKGVS